MFFYWSPSVYSCYNFVMSDDATLQNQSDLPTHWKVHTSISGENHHDDSPLFPPIKEKPLIVKSDIPLIKDEEEVLLPKNDEELLVSGKNNEMIAPTTSSNSIIEDEVKVENESQVPLIEINENDKAENKSPSEEVLVNNEEELKIDGVKQDNAPLVNLSSEVSNEVDTITEVKNGETVASSITPINDLPVEQNAVENNEIEIESDSDVFVEEEKQEPSISNLNLNNNFIKNSSLIKVAKVIPVPHIKIQETVDSEHPLTMPPRVIPFSTPAPSAHAKIAAVYTQPDARAAIWLPWMRTSMWTKKMVKRATKHPEVEIEHESLPVIVSNGKPNVVYSPVYVSPDIKPRIVREVKETNVFEKAAEVSRINFELKREEAKVEEVKIDNSINEVVALNIEPVKPQVAPPVVADSFDAALFGNASTEINKNYNNLDDINIATSKTQSIEKPKMNDSWDEAMFS